MREIVIDTETTGLDPLNGDRIVEIGAVELVDRAVTGNTFHRYLCPERSMPPDALAVHGLSAEFLADKPAFGAVVDEFLAFVGQAPLVAHNAGFDIAFLNAELLAAVYVELVSERQAALPLESITADPSNVRNIVRVRPRPLPPRVTADNRTAHREFVRTLGNDAVWLDYFTLRECTRAALS
jgi:DNA polymerase-3 subunit epsilon